MDYVLEKENQARELFKDGRNCSQSVFCTFCEDFGIDFETGLKLSSSFGGGMGKLREVCGAVSGMFMVAGLKFGYTSNDDLDAKACHYKLIQDLAEEFKQKHDTIICRELLGIVSDGFVPSKRTEEYYKTRPCEECIATAARITAKILHEAKIKG